MARTSRSAHALTDHEEIRRWAEERGARPTCVRGTGGGDDVGMIRLDFPGYSGQNSLQSIEWDEWLQKFDENNLALLVQDKNARGQKTNFNKLVSRDTAEERNEMQADRKDRSEGRTARSTRGSTRGRTSARTTRSTSGSRRRSASAASSRRSASGRSRKTRGTGRKSRSELRSSRSTARKGNTSARGSRTSSSTRKGSSGVRESSRRRAA
jgi:hypothetical protein